MAILRILQYPDLRLRSKSYMVDDVKSEKIKKIISDMLETLGNTENCAALAATQLDIQRPPSIVVINPMCSDGAEICLVNPRIISQEGRDVAKEGCMSIFLGDDIYVKVERSAKIGVEAINANGKKIKFEAEGFLARCIQHECDHLNGILYIDHLSKLKRSLLEKKILKLSRK